MLPRQDKRVDEAFLRQRWASEQFEFIVEKTAIEFRIVGDDWIVAEEFHQAVNDIGMLETLLVAQGFVGDACDADGGFRHGAARIHIDLEFAAGRQVVHQFDAAELYDAVAGAGIEAGGFGIEDDFAHESACSWAALIRVRSVSMIASTWASA